MNNTHESAEFILKTLITTHTALKQHTASLASGLARSETQLNRAKEFLDETCMDLAQGKPFVDHNDAFKEAHDRMQAVIKSMGYQGLVTVKLLAVASSFSWRFLSDVIPKLLREHELITCNVELLLVSPDHLEAIEAGENSRGEPWHEMSRNRVKQAQKFVSAMPPKVRGRYSLVMSYYKNIPHWHGVLIANTWLLLGRTSWEWKGTPELRVGENSYRRFNSDSSQGSDRIDLFNNWFNYYQQVGDIVYESIKG